METKKKSRINTKKLVTYGAIVLFVATVYIVLNMLIGAGVINRYYSGIIKMVCINIILAVSLNLVTGILGQLVLGHAGFMSVGAYTAALFSIYCSWDNALEFPVALLLGGLVAALFGIIIGIPALRLKGDYLAIITLGFGEIIRVILLALTFTGGALGLSGIPKNSSFTYVYFVAILTVVLIYTFATSRHGRSVLAIRENEIAAETSGVNTTFYKMLAFVMAAFFAGIAGGLYAHYIGIISPQQFDYNYSVEILVMVVLGGMGSITGSVVSATVLTVLPEMLRTFSDYRMLAYSILLIAMMLFRPEGLMGKAEFSISGIYDRLTGKGKNKKKKSEEES